MIPKKFTSHDTLPTQVLPFVVRMASHSDLEEVAALRSSAYGKHIPALGIKLREPEESDYAPTRMYSNPCPCKRQSGCRPGTEGRAWLKQRACA